MIHAFSERLYDFWHLEHILSSEPVHLIFSGQLPFLWCSVYAVHDSFDQSCLTRPRLTYSQTACILVVIVMYKHLLDDTVDSMPSEEWNIFSTYVVPSQFIKSILFEGLFLYIYSPSSLL